MAFYGPTFPNETHYEKLLTGRQRFGNRSANMFFIRPARHIACPRRLKYIHDIKTGYIPYVEDSSFYGRPSSRQKQRNIHDELMNKNNGLGLCNTTDTWRHELMELAQQVKSSFIPVDESEQYFRHSRSPRLNRYFPKRSTSSVSSAIVEDNDEQNISKRLFHQRTNPRYQQAKEKKPKPVSDKSEIESTNTDDNQDPGIWLIPILCYILQIDNIFEAQEWLVNANPTEKRLALELIGRTMQDMQSRDNDILSDISNSDLSTSASTASPNINNVYWPYKIWQRQEKDRHQQHQIQNYFKQSKLSSTPSLPSLTNDIGETCERATSPLRMLTPAKRSASTVIANQTTNHYPAAVEITVIEQPSTRSTTDRALPSVIVRQNSITKTERPITVDKQPATLEKRPSTRATTPLVANGNDRLSRRSYRVTTSLNNSIDEETKSVSPTRGKTPLI